EKEYFEAEFVNNREVNEFIDKGDKDEVRDWLKKSLLKRIEEKNLKFAPSYNELITVKGLPSMEAYEKLFGSYGNACREIGYTPLLIADSNISKKDIPGDLIILVDTREQKPLRFENSKTQKLLFGDYTLSGENYTYTYIDRKSEEDFKSTITRDYDR